MLPRLLFTILLMATRLAPLQGADEQAIVRAVLFYSPTCGHCEYVINETLVPMVQDYGDQLQIIAIDVTQLSGHELFLSAWQIFELEGTGVPFLVIGDRYLMGSADIPEKFPGLVEFYLAQGGVDWPDIPGLREAIDRSSETNEPTVASTTEAAVLQATPESATAISMSTPATATPGLLSSGTDTTNWTDRFARDPAGNSLAVVLLAGMLAALAWAIFLFRSTNGVAFKRNWSWSIPILCIAGLGVAGYLAYVETVQVTAVCGPVGDCNTVQQSAYARLFSIFPIGALGVFGYTAIGITWLFARLADDHLAVPAALALFAMTVAGTLFSIYLTFLEPFVIGATCAWCLASAVIMSLLFIVALPEGRKALRKLRANPFFVGKS